LHPEIFATVLGVTGGWHSCPYEHFEDGCGNRFIFTLILNLGTGWRLIGFPGYEVNKSWW